MTSKDRKTISVENPIDNGNKNRKEIDKDNLKKVTVKQMIDYLASNSALQQELFGKNLDEREIDNMRKRGIQAKYITKISESMELRMLTEDEAKILRESDPEKQAEE